MDNAPDDRDDPGAMPLVAALRRLAALEPAPGASRAANWQDRVAAMQHLHRVVRSHAHAQRAAGVAIERVIVGLKRLVTEVLRHADPAMEIAPVRDRAVGWATVAYFDDADGEPAPAADPPLPGR